MAFLAALSRRYFYYILGAIFFVFLLLQIQTYRSLEPPMDPISPYRPPSTVDDGHFHWSNLETHFPVKSLVSLPTGRPKPLPVVQYKFSTETTSERVVRLQRQQYIRDVFKRSWHSYRKHAWLYDELSPLSGGGRNAFGGWAATLVDALDSLWIMDMKPEFDEAAEAAANIDFSVSTDEVVNIFETTIRYLGGFLAAYDLSGNRILLDKAVEIGEMLLVAFDTPNHMPITRWQWQKAAAGERQEAMSTMLISELGTLSLEFTRLSQVTGDHRWYDAIQRITTMFDQQQEQTKLPGLWPILVNAKDEDLTSDSRFTLGGMSDSLYEYFPKQFILLGGLSEVYHKLYNFSMATAIERLFFRPMTPNDLDILISGDVQMSDDGQSFTFDPRGQHLGCFTGGMLGLAGKIFSNNFHVLLGRKLTEGCIWAYKASLHGVMPEIAHFVPCASKESCVWRDDLWTAAILERAGYDTANQNAVNIINNMNASRGYTSIDDKRYILRPEAIESVFVMYRITGDPFYRESAWEMFTAIDRISRTEFANAAIRDITETGADGLPPKDDRMESFWMAETLKYFYLIFSEPDVISLDEYVLNTEAHPFKRPA